MAPERSDIRAQLLATFRLEAEEHLQAITDHLMALDRGLSPPEAAAAIEATFREVHTLKGAARSVGMTAVESLCQVAESLLSDVTRGRLALSPAMVTPLQDAVDRIGRLLAGGVPVSVDDIVQALERVAAGPMLEPVAEVPVALRAPRPTSPPPAAAAPIDSLRVATARLDALSRQTEELLAPKLAAEERVREAGALVEALAACVGGLPHAPVLRAVEHRLRELLGHLDADRRALGRAVDDLGDELRRIRLIPAASVLDVFPRMVHELAREQGKEIDWLVVGGDLEVDRLVLDAVKDPLIHLVRNAVDHGIEAPAVRGEAGKPARGRVTAGIVPLEGGRIEIRIVDDGAGIDVERVRAAAVRAHLLDSEAAKELPDEQAVELVYRSGLSTSPVITDLSGHGLGLAIVKERVERLGGRIHLETQIGVGTTVRMILPATIATFEGLLVRAGGGQFLLPMAAVEQAVRVVPEEVQQVQGRPTVSWQGQPLVVAPLHEVLGLAADAETATAGQQPCIVVRAGAERAGLLVDEVLGDREVLVKELGRPLVRVRNVAGAGLLGTGRIALILRPTDVLASVRATRRPGAPAAGPRKPARQAVILVVDDSITTRTMEKNLLEATGYRVRVAVDGIEAWALLKSEAVDLVVSDVDMPRMDGFELTARIRGDRALADVPVVLVTALESREDKERGIEVGANAYVIKSSFDQSNLLEIIRRLV